MRTILWMATLATVLHACSSTGPNAFVRSSVMLDRSVIRAGEDVTVTISMVNEGPGVTLVTFQCPPFQVRDTALTWVGPGVACPAAPSPATELAEGQTISEMFTWDGTALSGSVISPGLYTVRPMTGTNAIQERLAAPLQVLP